MSPEVATTPEVFGVPTLALAMTVFGLFVVVALALEQLFNSWRLVEGARELGAEVGKNLYHGDLPAARTACERANSPVADIFIAALNKVNRPGESVRKAAERERQRFSLRAKRRLWVIGTVGALAPFIGLFGTVLGIIRSFRDIAASGAGGFGVVAQGVSEALWATGGGILVAVTSVAVYNLFQTRGNHITVEVKLVVDEFLEQLEARITGGGAPSPTRASDAEASSAGLAAGAPVPSEG
jgi:biopolymer transport protein ExbB